MPSDVSSLWEVTDIGIVGDGRCVLVPSGIESQDDFLASYNNMNPIFNFLCGNLGYHTAHHYKQGVHWSELPQLHEEIKDKIPKALFRRSLWDMWTLNPVFRFITRLFSIPT